jgi:DNA polymerase-4
MQKIIFHIDMNAYFASVEEILNPKLINKPLIVSGYSKKSVVSCPNYIARKYGIKAAMPVYKAIQLCPTVNICIPKMKEYQRFHNKFISIIKTKLSNLIEIVGIDECYVDVTHLSNKTEPIKLAKMIQNKIFTTTGLKSSIGISSNKFLAKMASDLKKPMGISTLFQNEIQEKIWPLDVGDMFMIGKKTAQVLKDQGINTIGDLANYDEKILSKLLNKNFLEYKAMANGFGSDVLDLEGSDPKSIGTSMTFNNNTNYFDEIKAVLSEQIHEI